MCQLMLHYIISTIVPNECGGERIGLHHVIRQGEKVKCEKSVEMGKNEGESSLSDDPNE